MWVLFSCLIIICFTILLWMYLKPNLVLITSVIHTHHSNLSYDVRSKYSPQQRYEQTLSTIESIRKHVPNHYIILVEGSHLTELEHIGFQLAGVNEIINCADELAEYINGPHKSVGELNMLLFALERIKLSRYNTISKISGRYYLSDNFDWYKSSEDKAFFQCETPPSTKCNTRYYRIPSKYFAQYKSILQEALKDPLVIDGYTDIETYNIFKDFKDTTKIIEGEAIMGVKGFIAPWGSEVED